MRRLITLLILLVLLSVAALPAAQAQTLTRSIVTPSGRLSLQIPDTWVFRELPDEEEIRGLDSETLVMGTSYDVIDQYLSRTAFDGTVMFLSAYPYHVYEVDIAGSKVDMLEDVTVYDKEDIRAQTFSAFDGAEFYYEETGQFFVSEVLFDTGEMTYRATIYSTRMDEYELVMDILNTAAVNPVSGEELFSPEQPTRRVMTSDERLAFAIPQKWLFWNEGDTSLSFATTGIAYADISYSFMPEQSHEIVFIVQRLVTSGLRPSEVTDGVANLEAVAVRLRDENHALRKSQSFSLSEFSGQPMLDASWLIPGTGETILTRTRLLDGGDAVYLIQAQYLARESVTFQPMVDAVFERMTYTPPAKLVDPNEVGLEVGMQAPDFTLPNLDGSEVSLSDFRGKVVFLNMWATWCGPCHREAPAMQEYYEGYNGRFEILAMNVGESRELAGGFVRQYNLTFPVVLDEFYNIAEMYDLTAYPTTYVISRDGVILEKIQGAFSEQGLEDVLAIYIGRQ